MQSVQFVYRQNQRQFRLIQALNLVCGVIAAVVAAPIVCAAAIAIALEDGFPVFFAQRRVGRFERTFVMYKLRTMRKEQCGDAVSPTGEGDARLTRVGRILRKTSIDEMPQLLNVLRGDMHLVGPRPEMPFIVNDYKDWQHMRHLVHPGITGLWQIRCRQAVPLNRPEATLIDLEYIQSASAAVDGALLAKTFTAVFSGHGAY